MPSLTLPDNCLSGPFSGDKILCHPHAIATLMASRTPSPILVELDMTNHCQLACSFCTNAEYRHAQRVRLGAAAASDVLNDMSGMGVKAVTFTGGGEPLVDPATPETIAKAKFLGLDVALITNGALITPETAKIIVSNCTWVRVSVDAYSSDSYAAAKGVDCWGDVLAGVHYLVKAKRQSGSSCTIGIGYLTDAANARHFVDCVRLFEHSGVDYVQARPIQYMPHDSRKVASVSPLPLTDATRYARDDFRVYAVSSRYADPNEPRLYDACTAVYFSCVIGATGDVWACCHWRGDKRFSLGNIHERPFAEIWRDTETRNRVYAGINVDECMPLCRFHRQNTLLAGVNWRPMHRNFL